MFIDLLAQVHYCLPAMHTITAHIETCGDDFRCAAGFPDGNRSFFHPLIKRQDECLIRLRAYINTEIEEIKIAISINDYYLRIDKCN